MSTQTSAAPQARISTTLEYPRLRRLLTALAFSQEGDWLYNLALLALVLDRTHSSTGVAVTTAARVIPMIVGGPFGGVVADRFDRRMLRVLADLVRAGCMVGLAAAPGPVAGRAAVRARRCTPGHGPRAAGPGSARPRPRDGRILRPARGATPRARGATEQGRRDDPRDLGQRDHAAWRVRGRRPLRRRRRGRGPRVRRRGAGGRCQRLARQCLAHLRPQRGRTRGDPPWAGTGEAPRHATHHVACLHQPRRRPRGPVPACGGRRGCGRGTASCPGVRREPVPHRLSGRQPRRTPLPARSLGRGPRDRDIGARGRPEGFFASTLLELLSQLALLRGDHEEAEREALAALAGDTDLQFTLPLAFIEAQPTRVKGEPDLALDVLERAMGGDSDTWSRYRWPVVWEAARCLADLRTRAHDRREETPASVGGGAVRWAATLETLSR